MGAEVAIQVSDDLRDAAAKKNLKTAPQLRRALAEQLEQHFVAIERASVRRYAELRAVRGYQRRRQDHDGRQDRECHGRPRQERRDRFCRYLPRCCYRTARCE